MTERNKERALQLVTTVGGKHQRGHINQRQIDVIKKEILPNIHCERKEIGIIAPYRDQVNLLVKALGEPEIDVATVHKFQGREKDVIVLSTVDDIVTNFSDDPNLLNVAVSRAKKKLIVVTSEEEQPLGSNIGDLISYIQYNNGEFTRSGINSIFDYMYDAYTAERMIFLAKHNKVSRYDSENLMYGLIQDELQKRENTGLRVISHVPLNVLIKDTSELSARECEFVNSSLSHLDFLIYSRVSKRPIVAIEVDGFYYHKSGTEQAERDKIKNHILEIYGLPLLRFATNGSGEAQRLSQKLDEILYGI